MSHCRRDFTHFLRANLEQENRKCCSSMPGAGLPSLLQHLHQPHAITHPRDIKDSQAINSDAKPPDH